MERNGETHQEEKRNEGAREREALWCDYIEQD